MHIASSSKDVKFHTWPDGNLVHCYKPTSRIEGPIRTISWAKDGMWLVLVPAKGQAEVISIKDNLKHLHTIHEIQQPTCAAFQNTTKKNIALGTTTGQVLVYDIKNKISRKRFPRACGAISKIEYCFKDTHLLASCENGEVLLYNNANCMLSSSYKIPNSKIINTLRCHPIKRNLVGGGSEEGVVAVWDINQTKPKGCIQAHAAPVNDIAFSPIRMDLLVSVGMDRKFCFYDILSNNIVLDITVDRALTSIDYCQDGMNIAVATLDGKIYHYDTRNMKEPMSTFLGHQGPIKNLLFQKLSHEEVGTMTLGDGIFDQQVHVYSEENEVAFDSFSPILSSDQGTSEEATSELESQQEHHEIGDSFMAAMGINVTQHTPSGRQDNSGIAEAVKKAMQEKPLLFDKPSILTHMSPIPFSRSSIIFAEGTSTPSQAQVSTIGSSFTVKPVSSTPKINIIPSQIPISSTEAETTNAQTAKVSATVSQATSANLQTIDFQQIRDILREEIRNEIQQMKVELRHEFIDIYANMRRQFLDMQMSMVKEFVQLENVLNRLRDDLTIDEGSEDEVILQENIRMRQELAILHEKLRQKED